MAKNKDSGINEESSFSHPVVQDLLDQESKRDLEKEVVLPYIIKDKILMSPGVWNGYYYSDSSLVDAFSKTDWTSKDNRSLFLDHEDSKSAEWIGEVRNERLSGENIIGDLVIVDKPTAMKLAYGARMGISPKVSGGEEDGKMLDFVFNNFSVVINPAVKTAYINNSQKENSDDGVILTKEEIVNDLKEEEVSPIIKKDSETIQNEEVKMADENVEVKPEEVQESVTEEVQTEKVTEDVQESAEATEEKSEGETTEEATVENAEKPAETVNEMSSLVSAIAALSEKFDKLLEQNAKIAEMAEKKEEKPEEEEKKPVKKEKEDGTGPNSASDKKEAVKKMSDSSSTDKALIQELSEKLEAMELKFNEPARESVRVDEMSQVQNQDPDTAFMSMLGRL